MGPGGYRVQQGGGGSDQGSAVQGLGLSSRQLIVQCEGQQAWELAGVLLAAWLHWCGGVEQKTAVDSVSRAMGICIDKVRGEGEGERGGLGAWQGYGHLH